MTKPDTAATGRKGALLQTYLFASHLIALIGPPLLRRRLARGKELPGRWCEKLGQPSLPRQQGPLVWLHAVGLGEVMALRGLIAAMARAAPETNFLVTSTTRASATLLAANLPPRTTHQFLPLDAPRYLQAFLDHWQPDLSVWSEQDIWPGAVVATAARGIPIALVNARMDASAFTRRRKWRGLYADIFSRFDLIIAQDETTAANLSALGAQNVELGGSLKSAAPPLRADMDRLAALQPAFAGRRVWIAASTHPEDEAVAVAAQAALWRADPSWLLILAPRYPERRQDILANLPPDMAVTVGSRGAGPTGAIHLADALGELGLWYRLAPVALIGGSYGPVGGHNPWEPAMLGAAVLHGANVANFAQDYALLDGAGAARAVRPEALADTLAALDATDMGAKGQALAQMAQTNLAPLASRLLALGGRA